MTTIGTPKRSTSGPYSLVPITVHTCPAARKPCTRLVGEERMAVIAGGTSTCETSMEKFVRPRRWACSTDIALAGAVVSKPTPKNTTCLSGFSAAMRVASSGE